MNRCSIFVQIMIASRPLPTVSKLCLTFVDNCVVSVERNYEVKFLMSITRPTPPHALHAVIWFQINQSKLCGVSHSNGSHQCASRASSSTALYTVSNSWWTACGFNFCFWSILERMCIFNHLCTVFEISLISNPYQFINAFFALSAQTACTEKIKLMLTMVMAGKKSRISAHVFV